MSRLHAEVLFLAMPVIALGCSTAQDNLQFQAGQVSAQRPAKIESEYLPNAYRVHAKVISGGQPDGEAGFRELQQLGVKTVISVDGAKPEVELAKKFGLRYVHLPHGYDGVPEQRAKELAKAVRDLPGPVYIHCHHGKHRSPAASAVACVAAGLIPPSDSLSILQTAGTSENYRGLYASAESAKRLDDELLDQLQADFPPTANLPPLAEAMVALGHIHDDLKQIESNGWKAIAKHPDIEPAHAALLMREHFAELLRAEETKQRPQAFQQMLRESEQASATLENLLRESATSGSPVSARVAKAFATVSAKCTQCHRDYRDNPRQETRQ